jgi:sugar-phosphatase
VITREDVLEAKPSPEGYLLAAERFQVEPGDCIVFEDSSAGIQAALEAGMRVIHVLPSDVSDCITHQSPKFEKAILGCTEFSGSSVERILGGHLK